MKSAIKQGAALAFLFTGLAATGSGCLTRPVTSGQPTTNTNFTSELSNQVIDKIDLLFDIDNSASMGDKQSYLILAIPDLINRLVNPDCIDPTTGGFLAPSTGGTCTTGQLEFPPVHDLHLGIVTSSLGSRLSEPGLTGVCDATLPATAPTGVFTNISAHNDDQGRLINRSLTLNGTTAVEGTVAAANTGNYLYWFPAAENKGKTATGPVTAEPTAGSAADVATVGKIGTPGTLIGDFSSIVAGAGIFGCGIESQLESWYRFLIQPDPYASLQPSNSNAMNGPIVQPKDMWVDVDTTVLQQRKDFLRPDSLVAIIVLTDENDSEIDVRSLGGQGYAFMRTGFHPPRATSVCASDPGNPACDTCSNPHPGDASCQQGAYTAKNDWGNDMNLRHVHMKAKYGLDPQYPVQRYAIGLTSTSVPDRHGEYENPDGSSTSNYIGRNDCTNPLFAASLPDGSVLDAAHLCNLPIGPRAANQVFYAVIGGVPNQLLHFKPGDALGSQLSEDDWKKILGTDPLRYDYDGIDPHMIEDYRDRAKVIAANGYPFTIDPSGTNPLSSSDTAPQAPDPVDGREWVTDQEMTAGTHVLPVDLQYACTFPLAQPRDCTLPENGNSCDCPRAAGGLTPQESPPLCNGTTQIAAKAYPTTRELEVAHLMGSQGIVSSLCPIHVSDQMNGNDPLFGYRPAVAVIIDRLKVALNSQCLGKLTINQSDNTVPCLVLVTMPPGSNGTCTNPTCDPNQGLSVPDPTLLKQFCDKQEQAYKDTGAAPGGPRDPANQSVCQLQELVQGPAPNGLSSSATVDYVNDFDSTGSCVTAQESGWCYVEGEAATKGTCSQAIIFSSSSPPSGAKTKLQCIERSVSVIGGSSASSP